MSDNASKVHFHKKLKKNNFPPNIKQNIEDTKKIEGSIPGYIILKKCSQRESRNVKYNNPIAKLLIFFPARFNLSNDIK
jgi:hypothetical protein